MRIISGFNKGKKLILPNDKKTRPLKDMAKESIKSLSPSVKVLIQPLYDFYFKKPLKKLMQNKISDYFDKDSDKTILKKNKKKDNHNSLLSEIKSTNPEIPSETLSPR